MNLSCVCCETVPFLYYILSFAVKITNSERALKGNLDYARKSFTMNTPKGCESRDLILCKKEKSENL